MWKNYQRMICLTLSVLLAFQTPLLASEQFCFEKPVAQKLLTEIKYSNITADKLLICQQSYSTSRAINTLDKKQLESLDKTNKSLITISEDLKKKWEDSAKQNMDCEASKPSRVTWFGAGFVSGLIITLVGLIAIK